MGGEQAANVLLTVREAGSPMSEAERTEFKAPILAKYEEEASAYYSSARLWDDGVIDPVDTRRVIGLGLEAAMNAPVLEAGFSLYRM
jgi:acetyl-CoA carboxylase carboxyltransferase component